MNKKIKRAFSLLEVIVILAILGIVLSGWLKMLSAQSIANKKQEKDFFSVTFCNNLSKNCLFDSKIHNTAKLIEVNF